MERIPLAKQLRERKEADITKAGKLLAEKILKLADMRYEKSHLVFKFKSKKGFFCLAKTPIKMELPTELRKKLNIKDANHSESEEAEKPLLEEWESLFVEIVEAFNGINSTVMGADGFSAEQVEILNIVTEHLTAECFKVSCTDRFMEVNWWGD